MICLDLLYKRVLSWLQGYECGILWLFKGIVDLFVVTSALARIPLPRLEVCCSRMRNVVEAKLSRESGQCKSHLDVNEILREKSSNWDPRR